MEFEKQPTIKMQVWYKWLLSVIANDGIRVRVPLLAPKAKSLNKIYGENPRGWQNPNDASAVKVGCTLFVLLLISGELSERFKELVLKTSDTFAGTVGSNPTLSDRTR